MRSEDTWRKRYNRPFKPKPYPPIDPPRVRQRTPGLDAIAAYLRELRMRLRK